MLLYREARTIFPVVQVIVFKERNPTQSLGVTSSITWRREWLPPPVSLPGEFHGQTPQSMG